MFRIVFVSIAIVSTICIASELLEKGGFYPESISEIAVPPLSKQRSEDEQRLAKLRQKSDQLQTSFIAADLTNAQPISFIFNTDNKQVTINVPYDSVWKPQKHAPYHIPSAPYNYAAMELFRTLIYKKTKEEVAQFWKDFFKLKFPAETVDFAQVRDSLFDLIDATQAQDVLLSGLIVITVPKDSVWRLKTVDNMRGLPNGDILYYIIDENYDQITIKLFNLLVHQKTKEEVEQFWRDFESLGSSKKEIIEKELLDIIYLAGAQEALLAGLLYTIQFQLNKNIVDTVPIDQKQVALFDYLKTLLEDLKDVRTIPVPLDNTGIDVNQVTTVFELLLQCLSSAQVKIDAVNKMQHFVGDKQERTLREISYACIGVYGDVPLELIVQSLALALYLGLQQPYSTYLGDVYVNKLMESRFTVPSELLKIMPTNLEVDSLVVKIMMQKLLGGKYLYSKSPEQKIKYFGVAEGVIQKVIYHEDPFLLDPYVFMRATLCSGILPRYASLPRGMRATRANPMLFNTSYGLDKNVFDMEFFDKYDAVVITKDEIKLIHLNVNAQQIEEGMSQKLPVGDITDGYIRRLSNVKFCAGCADYISLFSIKNNKIVDFKSYKIETSIIGTVSDLFVLDDMVAISYKTLANEYQYFFFDANKKMFLKEPHNALEIQYAKTAQYEKKMIILLRNEDLCINRSLIINARKFTQLFLTDAMFIDSAQENLYLIHEKNIDLRVGKVKAVKYAIVPTELKSAIDAINDTEKALRGKAQRTYLTLDLLYFIAHEYPTMVAAPDNIKKLENFVSAPMKAALRPILSNKVKSSYFSWSDAFKRQLKWFAGIAAGVGLTGIAAYVASKAGYSISNLYTPTNQSALSTAITRKLQIPQGAQ